MTDLQFEDPGPPNTFSGRARDWDSIAEKLMANPLKWLLVEKGARLALYNSLRQGSTKAMHPGLGFEATTRNNDYSASPRTADVYVRYNPAKDERLTDAQATKAVTAAERTLAREKKETK